MDYEILFRISFIDFVFLRLIFSFFTFLCVFRLWPNQSYQNAVRNSFGCFLTFKTFKSSNGRIDWKQSFLNDFRPFGKGRNGTVFWNRHQQNIENKIKKTEERHHREFIMSKSILRKINSSKQKFSFFPSEAVIQMVILVAAWNLHKMPGKFKRDNNNNLKFRL